jgi:tetratricopeptide (TPR) repeat protein
MIRKFLLLSVVLLIGCSQSLFMQGRSLSERGEYDRAIEIFYDEIRANPQNAEAWRELGIALFRKGELDKAEDALKQANNMKPDARTHVYLGLVNEKREDYDQAVNSYSAAIGMDPNKETRDMLRIHLDRLLEKKFRKEAAEVAARENEINASEIPANTVGVVDFDASTLSPELAPIGIGLAELTSIDLAKVKSLRVMERLKIKAVLEELELAKGDYVDKSTAPRLGKIVGSSRIITGSVLGSEDNLRLDGAIVHTVDESAKLTGTTEGELQRFFRMEKDFVFKIIDELGITLTAEERDSIMKVPTESYLAFMSYCRGLDYKNRGMYKAAETEFRQAAGHDAGFGQAGQQAAAMSQMAALGGTGGYSDVAFEQTIYQRTLSESPGVGLDGRINSVLNSTGTIPGGGVTPPPLNPPVVGADGLIIIRGDFR